MFDSGIEFIDDYIRPKYKCIKDYETISIGDIVSVSTSFDKVCITFNRHAYFINYLTFEERFEKVGK